MLALLKLGLLIIVILAILAILGWQLAKRWLGKKIEQSFGEVAKVAAIATQPPKIHLERFDDNLWTQRAKVSAVVASLRRLGYRPLGNYRIPEMPDLQVVGLAHPEEGFGAAVYESQQAGDAFFDVLFFDRKGGGLSVSTAPDAGLPRRPGFDKIFHKSGTPATKLDAILRDRAVPRAERGWVHPGNFMAVFEAAYAAEIAVARSHQEQEAAPPIERDPELDARCAPLFEHIQAGNLAGVQAFRLEGVAPEGRNEDGRTPLMSAVSAGEISLVQALLDAGADPNARAPGRPGIEMPSFRDSMAEAQDAAKGDAEAQKFLKGFTAVMGALGADAEDAIVAVTPLGLAIVDGAEEIVQLLLQRGALVERPAEALPLCLAAEHGRLETARKLIVAGASADGLDGEELPPLYYAISEGHTEIVDLLLEADADVTGKEGMLLYAADDGNREMVERMLHHAPKRLQKKALKRLAKAEKEMAEMEEYDDEEDDFESMG